MADQLDPAMVAFGKSVRAFRVARGLTQEQLAQMISYSKGWLSNVETGQLRPVRKVVIAIQTALSISDNALIELYDLLSMETLPVWLRDWLEEERRASAIRAFQGLVVHGLLQIEDYARALLGGNEAALHARMARQERLISDDAPRVMCVMDELALYREIGGPAIMRAQLKHLIECASTYATIQVVPSAANPHRMGSFVIATVDGAEVAYVDTAIRGMVTNSRDDLRSLNEAWESIRSQSLPVGMSMDLIKKVARERWT